MTNSQFLNLLIERLGARRNFSRPLLLLEINAKIEEFERGSFCPWFLEAKWEEVIPAGERSIALPEDFLKEVEDGILELVSEASQVLYPKKRPIEILQQIRQAQPEGGTPSHYAIWAGELHLAPTPLSTFAITLPYFKMTAPVEDNAGNVTSWLKEAKNFISYIVLTDVSANELKDDASAAKFKALASEAYARLYKYNESRQHINADYQIGGEV